MKVYKIFLLLSLIMVSVGIVEAYASHKGGPNHPSPFPGYPPKLSEIELDEWIKKVQDHEDIQKMLGKDYKFNQYGHNWTNNDKWFLYLFFVTNNPDRVVTVEIRNNTLYNAYTMQPELFDKMFIVNYGRVAINEPQPPNDLIMFAKKPIGINNEINVSNVPIPEIGPEPFYNDKVIGTILSVHENASHERFNRHHYELELKDPKGYPYHEETITVIQVVPPPFANSNYFEMKKGDKVLLHLKSSSDAGYMINAAESRILSTQEFLDFKELKPIPNPETDLPPEPIPEAVLVNVSKDDAPFFGIFAKMGDFISWIFGS